MRSVELFSGCGGLALGTARAGFEHIRMIEWNADACATLALNKRNKVQHARDWEFVHGDVQKMEWSTIKVPVDLVAGGPPCQPFSIGGKHRGNEDIRDMWPEAIRAVRELMPRAFLFENVKGLLRPVFGDYLEWIRTYLAIPLMERLDIEAHDQHLLRMKSQLSRADYEVAVLKVNAADYGAAQKRHRVVLAGVRRGMVQTLKSPLPTHSREALMWDQWVSGDYWVRHGLARPEGPTKDADKRLVSKLLSTGRRPETAAWVTVRDAIKGLGDPNGKNGHIFQDGARAYVGHTGSPLDEPAKALKAGDHGVPGGENMMVRDDGSVRYFTIREAARLQGLPDDWSFATSWSESMRQLGNAVPTQLSEAMGRWIAGILSNNADVAKEAA